MAEKLDSRTDFLRRGVSRGLGLVFLAAVLALSCAAAEKLPRNVIVMIADGMGHAHLTAALLQAGTLHMARCATGGCVVTSSASDLVTDSAAAATALATGSKTANHVVSLSADGRPLATVAEVAARRGMATGLVVTSAVTHATPAAFFSHAGHRKQQPAIAAQLAESGLHVAIGGGWGWFAGSETPGSLRPDKTDLLAAIRNGGGTVVLSTDELRHHHAAGGGKSPLFALLAADGLPPVQERGMPLAEMVGIALGSLSGAPGGFFLLVEGSQIDWAGHGNNFDWLVAETLDFDGAVGAALDYAEGDGSTLVLIVSDHETGGLALKEESARAVVPAFASGKHTATVVPLFAHGPGSARFGGLKDNAAVGRILLDLIAPPPALPGTAPSPAD